MDDYNPYKLSRQEIKIIKREEQNRKKIERREKRTENAEKAGEVFADIGIGILEFLGALAEIAGDSLNK